FSEQQAWLAAVHAQHPLVVAALRSVLRVIEQESPVARPAGCVVPQPGLLQELLLVAETGSRFAVQRVAETAARLGDASAVGRPGTGRVDVLAERQPSAPAAGDVDRPEIARSAVWRILRHRTFSIGRQRNTCVRARRSESAERPSLPIDPGELKRSR